MKRPAPRPDRSDARRLALAAACAVLAPAAIPAQADDHAGPDAAPAVEAAAEWTRWYTLELGGEEVGWSRSARTADGTTITSTDETRLEIARAGVTVVISLSTSFAETRGGRPIEASVTQDFGGGPRTTTYTFGDDAIAARTVDAAGNERAETHPLPEGRWLPPAAADEFLARRLASGAGRVAYRTLDPSIGPGAISIAYEDIEPATIELGGRTLDAFTCRVSTDAAPGVVSTEHLDPSGRSLRSVTRFGAFDIVATATDEAAALAERDAPELFLRTFITPDRPIAGARASTRATFTVRTTDGGPLPPLPSAGHQRVTPLGETAARVRVDTALPRAEAAPLDAEAQAEFLASSAVVAADDPVIVALAADAAGRETDPARLAERLRAFVHGYIRAKDLSVGFADASTVAREREGDCSEHAVLLAAMLRARGVPARVASGLIYADTFAGRDAFFGYHMWTQALVPDASGEPRWADYDATLPRARTDATHIVIATSPLADGDITDGFLEVVNVMGRLAIEVERVDD